MPNVQVRDLPDDVHSVLVQRAERAGQSLQQYLTAQLAWLAASPTADEVLDRIEQRATGDLSSAQAIEALDEARADR